MRDEGAYKQLLAPLATSRSGLMMLLAGDLGALKSVQREYLENILQLNEHMIGLVNGWLDVDRLQQGRVVLQVEPCNIGAIARQVARVGISVTRSGDWPMVMADQVRLKQLMSHLYEVVDKARVRARVDADMCVLTIDTHVAVDHQERLLLIKAIKSNEPTNYLGLRIAGLLAEAHGGSLYLDPHATQGLKFHLRIPLARQMSLLGELKE